MIYMEPSSLGYEPILKSWINNLPELLTPWLRTFIYESLFLRFCRPLLYLLRHSKVTVDNIFLYSSSYYDYR